MSDVTTLDKIAAIPEIMEAARKLRLWGLYKEDPAATVKRFVEANPDISARLREAGDRTHKFVANGNPLDDRCMCGWPRSTKVHR